MSEAHHDLSHEFPEFADKIHQLKSSDEHFVRLAGEYHDLVKQLHRIEIGEETPSDEYTEELKKKRLDVLDSIAAVLRDSP